MTLGCLDLTFLDISGHESFLWGDALSIVCACLSGGALAAAPTTDARQHTSCYLGRAIALFPTREPPPPIVTEPEDKSE